MHSVWLASSPAQAQPSAVPLQGRVSADVVVIGAGLSGTAAARRLARAGASVVWLEASSVAERATGRNAGFILQGTAERYSRAVAIMGRERARRVHAWSVENHARLYQTVRSLGIDCGYRKVGSLQLASSPEEEQELVESARLLNEDGFRAELVRGEALEAVHRAAGFDVGVVLPDDGELDPVAFTRAAAHDAVQQGARLFAHTPVVDLLANAPGQVRARTPQGEVHAEVAVVCTNAATGTLLPWFADVISPVRGQMLSTAPLAPVFARPVYADHGFDYWRQDHRGRVVLGGWRNLDPGAEVGFDEVLHPDIQERMEGFLRRYPALATVPIEHRWAGIMGFSRDGLPLVGASPGAPGAVVCAGFTGHGFGFAWLCGESAADLVLEGTHPVLEDFSPRRLG